MRLVLLALLTLLVMRLAQAKRIKATWKPYAVKTGEDINALAHRHGVSWKLLAQVNNLKPPYALKTGDSIKVPPVKPTPSEMPLSHNTTPYD